MKSHLSGVFRDKSGGVVPLLALAALPLMTSVGMAVDYTRASAAKTALQSATNSAALLLYKKAALQNASDLQVAATAYVSTILKSPRDREFRHQRELHIERRLKGDRQCDGRRSDAVHGSVWICQNPHQKQLDLSMGEYAAAGCAGAR